MGERCMVSAANELHGSQGAQEKHRGNAEGVDCKPPDREDRVVARSGASGNLGQGLFQALVERGLGVIALAHHGGLRVLSLEVSVRSGSPEGVIGQSCVHEQEPSQEDRRQGHGMDHPVPDARDDFKERAFTR